MMFLCISIDMVVPEPGEAPQSVCKASGGPTKRNMYISDQEDLRLLLQVQYLKTTLNEFLIIVVGSLIK